MIGQGVIRSLREMAQKSCPSGAPIRAAAACRAERPGATAISTRNLADAASESSPNDPRKPMDERAPKIAGGDDAPRPASDAGLSASIVAARAEDATSGTGATGKPAAETYKASLEAARADA